MTILFLATHARNVAAAAPVAARHSLFRRGRRPQAASPRTPEARALPEVA
jgi:hypothetical protein